jgi:hypothetical protein
MSSFTVGLIGSCSAFQFEEADWPPHVMLPHHYQRFGRRVTDRLVMRRHADGRMLVYADVEGDRERVCSGYLIDGDSAELISRIRALCTMHDVPASHLWECLDVIYKRPWLNTSSSDGPDAHDYMKEGH